VKSPARSVQSRALARKSTSVAGALPSFARASLGWLTAVAALGLSGCGLEREASGTPTALPEPGVDAAVIGQGDAQSPPLAAADAGAAGPQPEAGSSGAPDATVEPPVDAGKDCKQTGRFGVRLQSQVRWAGTTLFDIVPIITPGVGVLSVYVMADFVESGGGTQVATVRACGTTIPDFSASVGETYGVVIPDEVWENVTLSWTTTFNTSCRQPGCTYSADPITAQLGLGIPPTDPWPSARDPIDVATLRDDDDDDVPGILLRARGPKDKGPVSYMHPPINYLLSERASEIWIAIRLHAELQGKLDTCDSFGGGVPNTTLDTRALACRLDSGKRCNDDELSFVDDNLPVWKVETASVRALRLPDHAQCADVRALKY
jgi:hypothetical protein